MAHEAILSQSVDDATFIVVDVETTGMSPLTDRMTEIAMMKIQRGVLVDEFSSLINPLQTISHFITNLTGIDNLMVRDAPTARELVPDIAQFLSGAVFVAHNAAFDWGFVYHSALRERALELSNPTLCTVKLSRKILPHLPSRSLGPVAEHLDIKIPQRHRASGDAYATSLVLIKFLSFLKRTYAIQSVEELLNFQTSRRRRPAAV
jgi:DNA polymerase III epsilon subunit family exonuclease